MSEKTQKVQVSFRIDGTDKEKVTEIYEALGINLSTAFSVFVKKSISDGGFPFDVRDPFYSESNINELAKRLEKAKKGIVTPVEEYEKLVKENGRMQEEIQDLKAVSRLEQSNTLLSDTDVRGDSSKKHPKLDKNDGWE